MRVVTFWMTIYLVTATVYQVNLILPNTSSVQLYNNSVVSSQFSSTVNPLNCVQPQNYIFAQTASQTSDNALYSLEINGDSQFSVSLTSLYGSFYPTINPKSCIGSCVVFVQNNCPTIIDSNNYFDILHLQVTGLPSMYYKVQCDVDYVPATFQWGLFLLLLYITVLITLSAYFSRAWSIGGRGIMVNYWMILALNIIWIVGAVMGAFIPQPTYIIVLVLSWIFGILAVGFCCNQALWLIKSPFLNKPLFWLVRPMDIISLLVGTGVMMSWWFTTKNWISSDIIGTCVVLSFIKIFKFTSLKRALVMLSSVLLIEIVIALIIHYVVQQSYNSILLNDFNNPMFLQLPTITKNLNQQCAWIPVTEVIFPGMVLSYLRRFDESRNTRMYILVSSLGFYIGSMVWMTITIFNIHSWPFAMFSQTLMFIVVVLFAAQRNQIKIVWSGKFYDEEFAAVEQINKVKQSFAAEQQVVEIRQSLFETLRMSNGSVVSRKQMQNSINNMGNSNHRPNPDGRI